MIKGTFHKSCHCATCQRGAHSAAGQYTQNQNERKLRRLSRQQLANVLKGGDPEEAVIAPITSPYTD